MGLLSKMFMSTKVDVKNMRFMHKGGALFIEWERLSPDFFSDSMKYRQVIMTANAAKKIGFVT